MAEATVMAKAELSRQRMLLPLAAMAFTNPAMLGPRRPISRRFVTVVVFLSLPPSLMASASMAEGRRMNAASFRPHYLRWIVGGGGRRREREIAADDGEEEGRDEEDREPYQQAGYLLEAAARVGEEDPRDLRALRRPGVPHPAVQHEQGHRVLQPLHRREEGAREVPARIWDRPLEFSVPGNACHSESSQGGQPEAPLRSEMRQRKGENLDGLDMEELRGLEQSVDDALQLVRRRKYHVISTQTDTCKKKALGFGCGECGCAIAAEEGQLVGGASLVGAARGLCLPMVPSRPDLRVVGCVPHPVISLVSLRLVALPMLLHI